MGATELIPVTVPRGTYFGPVHEVEHTQRFVTVLVPATPPAPDAGLMLRWVNVWTSVRGGRVDDARGTSFATQVLAAEKQEWEHKGWVDRYLTDC